MLEHEQARGASSARPRAVLGLVGWRLGREQYAMQCVPTGEVRAVSRRGGSGAVLKSTNKYKMVRSQSGDFSRPHLHTWRGNFWPSDPCCVQGMLLFCRSRTCSVGGIVFFSVTAAGNLISTLLWRMIVVASDKLVATPTARTLMTYDNEATGTAHVEQLQVRRWVMGQGG